MKGHPGAKIRAACWLLAGFFFAYDVFVWGGLAFMPKLGGELRHDASLHSPIAATYLATGAFVVEKAGYVDGAREFSKKQFCFAFFFPKLLWRRRYCKHFGK